MIGCDGLVSGDQQTSGHEPFLNRLTLAATVGENGTMRASTVPKPHTLASTVRHSGTMLGDAGTDDNHLS